MTKFSERFYRNFTNTQRWKSFRVKVETTDLFIRAGDDYSEYVKNIVLKLRKDLSDHIKKQSQFLFSLVPVSRLQNVEPIVSDMYRASEIANVGPMAAVAGAISESVGRELLAKSDEVIIENGGDIFLSVVEPVIISVFAGDSVFSGRVGIKIKPESTPLGVCTSSGRVGHSLSFGKADSATIISKDTALADAVATQMGNIAKTEDDLDAAIDYAMNINAVSGAILILHDKLLVKGDVELANPGFA